MWKRGLLDVLALILGGTLLTLFAASALAAPPDPASHRTTWFGGTVWDADSSRWEALRDSVWTFDTGVGSSFDHSIPGVDPDKDPSLHALMEGWLGIDYIAQHLDVPWRIVDAQDPRWDPSPCGDGMTDNFAWLGLFREEADSLCYVSGQGVGNYWSTELSKAILYPGTGRLNIGFDYAIEGTEDNVLHIVVYWEDSFTYSLNYLIAPDAGHFGHVFQQDDLPAQADTVLVRIIFSSYEDTDEDGLGPTSCGAVAIDNIRFSGIATGLTDFESGWDGWTSSYLPGRIGLDQLGGEYSRLAHLDDLTPYQVPGPCALEDSVLLFDHPLRLSRALDQTNFAFSPWIDLEAHGLVDPDSFLVEFDYYQEFIQLDYTGIMASFQWYPEICPATGAFKVSDEVYSHLFGAYSFGHEWSCSPPDSAFRVGLSGRVGPGATRIRVGLGLVTYCRFWAECIGIFTTTPWLDNVRVGVLESIPTPVGLSFFTAGWDGEQGMLRWEAGSAGTSFRVYRQGAGSGREELTTHPLSGRKQYTFVDESAPGEGAEYWLTEIGRTGESTWHGPAVLAPLAAPLGVALSPPAPNPFTSMTRVSYSLPGRRHVRLIVYDLLGRHIATLVDRDQDAGEYTSSWDGGHAASGIYFVRLEVGGATRTRRVLLVR